MSKDICKKLKDFQNFRSTDFVKDRSTPLRKNSADFEPCLYEPIETHENHNPMIHSENPNMNTLKTV